MCMHLHHNPVGCSCAWAMKQFKRNTEARYMMVGGMSRFAFLSTACGLVAACSPQRICAIYVFAPSDTRMTAVMDGHTLATNWPHQSATHVRVDSTLWGTVVRDNFNYRSRMEIRKKNPSTFH